MSRKIAPTLRNAMEHDGSGLDPEFYDHADGKRAAAELRALLAVARAAERLTKPPAPCPPICKEWSDMFAALRRLSPSKAKPRRGGGRR